MLTVLCVSSVCAVALFLHYAKRESVVCFREINGLPIEIWFSSHRIAVAGECFPKAYLNQYGELRCRLNANGTVSFVFQEGMLEFRHKGAVVVIELRELKYNSATNRVDVHVAVR